jgi:hypothetical protein
LNFAREARVAHPLYCDAIPVLFVYLFSLPLVSLKFAHNALHASRKNGGQHFQPETPKYIALKWEHKYQRGRGILYGRTVLPTRVTFYFIGEHHFPLEHIHTRSLPHGMTPCGKLLFDFTPLDSLFPAARPWATVVNPLCEWGERQKIRSAAASRNLTTKKCAFLPRGPWRKIGEHAWIELGKLRLYDQAGERAFFCAAPSRFLSLMCCPPSFGSARTAGIPSNGPESHLLCISSQEPCEEGEIRRDAANRLPPCFLYGRFFLCATLVCSL